MGKEHEHEVTAALTFNVAQKVGWSVQRGERSWSGIDMAGLVDRLNQEGGAPVTLSLSLIFDFAGNGRTVRSSNDPPQI